MRFLSAIVDKLASNRWLVRKSSRNTISFSRDFFRVGRVGLQASIAATRMNEALSRLGPAANAIGVSRDELVATVAEWGRSIDPNITVTTVSVTDPPPLEPPVMPVCKPPKEDLSTCTGEEKPKVRMIHFKGGG